MCPSLITILAKPIRDHCVPCEPGSFKGNPRKIGPFRDNVCIGYWDNIDESLTAQQLSGLSGNNSFYTMPGYHNVTVNKEPLAQAQAAGLEPGSSLHTFASLGNEGTLTIIRQLLGM
eukprot:SAG31_NODE_1975_length_6751_cov_2.067498_5_plen_117_part_00